VVYLFYARLIGLTAGTLVYLFLIALILGHRRPRLFERLLFFLVLALFAIYAGGLLEINAEIQYGSPPYATQIFCESLFLFGVFLLPGALVYAGVAYDRLLRPRKIRWWQWPLLLVFALYPIARFFTPVIASGNFRWPGFQSLAESYSAGLDLLLLFTTLVGAGGSLTIVTRASGVERRAFQSLAAALFVVSIPLLVRDLFFATQSPTLASATVVATVVLATAPGVLLIYYALKHNFLEYGAQRNLVYALSATFLALLYLALVHRISGWLAPVFPPEATASVLLFVLIFLFEPLERVIGPVLHQRLRERMDRTQRLSVELQTEARHGDLARLIARAEELIRREFGLAAVRISISNDPARKPLEAPGGLGHAARIVLVKDKKEIGALEAATTGAFLTGETTAALEFLAEQIPAMADLCRLIEEKLRLERELAEHERMAMLGQMAARVSHNLRNPLSSMKTILQVQMENRDLPADMRHDSALVLDEIHRMNAKLTQLLKFAKPAPENSEPTDAVPLARKTVALFRHDAERRKAIVELDAPEEAIAVLASEEALGEVLSNLVVNAIEEQPEGGRVRVSLARSNGRLEICVEDHGPGISAEIRARIFQPFFTTKATGTGLGLAIVARRVDEMGGTIACESPIDGGKGSRFRVSLPIASVQREDIREKTSGLKT
jgi:signal transduction histidine kinase